EGAVDREAVFLAPHRLVAFEAEHAVGSDERAQQRVGALLALLADRGAGFERGVERVVALADPVLADRRERLGHSFGGEGFEEIDACFLAPPVIGAGEHVDGAVVVGGAEDVVEEYPAVEETPADIPHHGAQEAVDLDDVAAPGPGDVGEILVAAELEAAELEAGIAGLWIGA